MRVFSSRLLVFSICAYVFASSAYSMFMWVLCWYLTVRLLGGLRDMVSMKDFLAFAQERRSYRRFRREVVPLEMIADCLLAASFAPSAGDIQPWEFVILSESEVLDGVVRACEAQDWLHDAPIIVLVLADLQKATDFHGDSGRLWARDSCSAAVQNLLLAAHERGLGSCWVSSFDETLLQEVVEFPDRMQPVALVALGFSDELLIEKSVHPLEQLIHFDTYGRGRRDQDTDINDYGDFFAKRKQEIESRLRERIAESSSSDDGVIARVRDWFQKSKK